MNIKIIEKNYELIGLHFVDIQARIAESLGQAKAFYTAPCLGTGEWSPKELYDKSVSLIQNTDETLKLVKKKMNSSDSTWSTQRPGAVEGLGQAHPSLKKDI